jgi:hypothetical protein
VELNKRTLTNLYNARPAWLAAAHRKLDKAVFAAYGWPTDISRDEILRRLLELNHKKSAGPLLVPRSDLPPKKAPGVERLPRQMPAAKVAAR